MSSEQPLPALPGEEDCAECEGTGNVVPGSGCLACGGSGKSADRQPLPGEEAESKESPAELVERVAKAIYESDGDDLLPWPGLVEGTPGAGVGRELYRHFARAAIKAIRPAETPDWHERPTSPGYWMQERADGIREWWTLDAAEVKPAKVRLLVEPGDRWYGPVVVPEQGEKP